MNLPSGANFEMRPIELGVPGLSSNCALCDSPTKILPLGATSTSLGSVNASGGLPAAPGLPSTSSTLPCGLKLVTVLRLAAAFGDLYSAWCAASGGPASPE